MRPTVVDLFCGCGGLSRGLRDAGFEVLAGIDSWAPAVKVYGANAGHDAIRHDLSDEEATFALVDGYSPDVIAGGPPCQDFSSAGKRSEGDRADLTPAFARTVTRVRPRAFIMENVSRAAHSEAYVAARAIFKEAGYGVTTRLLDASRCGVPQLRKRLFMVGALGAGDGFLEDALAEGQAPRPMTVREHFGEGLGFDHYYRHPRTYERRAIFSVDEPSPTVRGVNRPRPATYARHPNDRADPEGVRSMTFLERARVQTFPDDYVWPEGVAKGALEQMIGNAVPVKLGEHVGRSLLSWLRAQDGSGLLVAAE